MKYPIWAGCCYIGCQNVAEYVHVDDDWDARTGERTRWHALVCGEHLPKSDGTDCDVPVSADDIARALHLVQIVIAPRLRGITDEDDKGGR
jgi:hypothetical protein